MNKHEVELGDKTLDDEIIKLRLNGQSVTYLFCEFFFFMLLEVSWVF